MFTNRRSIIGEVFAALMALGGLNEGVKHWVDFTDHLLLTFLVVLMAGSAVLTRDHS